MRRLRLFFWFFCIGIWFTGALDARETEMPDVSLDELLNMKISTAAKYEQTTREASASVTIVTAEDIEHYGYRTLEDVLRSVRGFYVSNDRNYGYVGVRGFGRPTDYNNRVLLLVNGHTFNDNIWGGASIGTELPMNLDAVERIEIVRGPGSALYGTYAMFAVVNLITRKGNVVDGLDVSAEVGSYGRIEGRATFGKAFDSGMDVSISGLWGDCQGQDLYYEEYDDPSSNDGIAEDLDWDRYYGLFTSFTHGDFTFQGFLASREKGIPTGAWDVIFNDADSRTLDETTFEGEALQETLSHPVSRFHDR